MRVRGGADDAAVVPEGYSMVVRAERERDERVGARAEQRVGVRWIYDLLGLRRRRAGFALASEDCHAGIRGAAAFVVLQRWYDGAHTIARSRVARVTGGRSIDRRRAAVSVLHVAFGGVLLQLDQHPRRIERARGGAIVDHRRCDFVTQRVVVSERSVHGAGDRRRALV